MGMGRSLRLSLKLLEEAKQFEDEGTTIFKKGDFLSYSLIKVKRME